MNSRLGAASRLLMSAVTGLFLGGLVSGCGGGTSNPNSALPAQSTQSVVKNTQSLSLPAIGQSPYLRTFSNGNTVHIYPLPQDRPMVQPAMPSVSYHGGQVIDHPVAYAIYWQPPGSYMSSKYKTVIDQYFNDVGSTSQYAVLVQYNDLNGNPQNASSFGGSWTDTRPFPKGMNDQTIQDEVSRAIAIKHWVPGGIGPIFFVFTASEAPVSFGYCAYHGSFMTGNNPTIYSLMPYQHDISPQGCGTPSTVWPNDRDADQTIDTLWHEHGESMSDPVNAWWSNQYGEIGDICGSSYGHIGKDGADTTLHHHRYVTQEMWSNATGRCEQTYP